MTPALAWADPTWKSDDPGPRPVHIYLQTNEDLPKEAVYLQFATIGEGESATTSLYSHISKSIVVVSNHGFMGSGTDQALYCLLGYGDHETQARLRFPNGKMTVERRGGIGVHGNTVDLCDLRDISDFLAAPDQTNKWLPSPERDVLFASPQRVDYDVYSGHSNNLVITPLGPVGVGVGEGPAETRFFIFGKPRPDAWVDIQTRKLHVSGFEGVHLSPAGSPVSSPVPVPGS